MRFPTGTIGWFDFILFVLKYIEITLILAFWPMLLKTGMTGQNNRKTLVVLMTHTIHHLDFMFCVLKYRKNSLILHLIWNLCQPIWSVVVVVNCCWGCFFVLCRVSCVLNFFCRVSGVLDLFYGVSECSSCFLITCNTLVTSLLENWYKGFWGHS